MLPNQKKSNFYKMLIRNFLAPAGFRSARPFLIKWRAKSKNVQLEINDVENEFQLAKKRKLKNEKKGQIILAKQFSWKNGVAWKYWKIKIKSTKAKFIQNFTLVKTPQFFILLLPPKYYLDLFILFIVFRRLSFHKLI